MGDIECRPTTLEHSYRLIDMICTVSPIIAAISATAIVRSSLLWVPRIDTTISDTAFIASRGGWLYCDDSRVQPTDAKDVVVCCAFGDHQ